MTDIPIITSPYLPSRPPTPAEQGKRIVRNGLADVLAWLGEEVGPEPDAPVFTTYLVGAALYRMDLLLGNSVIIMHPNAFIALSGLS